MPLLRSEPNFRFHEVEKEKQVRLYEKNKFFLQLHDVWLQHHHLKKLVLEKLSVFYGVPSVDQGVGVAVSRPNNRTRTSRTEPRRRNE